MLRRPEALLLLLGVLLSPPAVQTAVLHVKLRGTHHERQRVAPETLSTIDWAASGLASWSDIEANLSSTATSLNVSSNAFESIQFTSTHEQLTTFNCDNTSLTKLDASMTYLTSIEAAGNLLTSFDDLALPSTVVSLKSFVGLGEFHPPRDLQILNVSGNWIGDLSGSNLSSAVNLVSIDLSSNNLTSVVGMIFPTNLTSLDLSNNIISSFEVREADFTILSGLSEFKMNDLKQSGCPTSGASRKTINEVQVCVVSDYVFQTAFFRTESAWKAGESIIYLSIVVSSLISLWFLALLVAHTLKRKEHTAKDTQHRDTMETSSSFTESRNWSLSKAEELPEDVRFDPDFASLRIDPSDVMQVRTLAHGVFAITSLVYLGEKQAVMKKVTMHAQGQDRDQMVAFMEEIRVCAKLDHPKVLEFLGIMWSSLLDLAAIVEYVPRGNLWLLLKEKKSARKSTFSWMHSSGEAPSKLSLALQISEALTYLQSFSPPVIHGHLKAECVLLGSSYEVKLSGLGYQIGTSSGEDRGWVAPEVLAKSKFDDKSDIYSFGVVLSELDRCKYPYSRLPSRRQSVDDGPHLRPKFRDDCPAEVLQIAQKCLQDDPADRPTAMELYYSLRQLQRQSNSERRGSTDV